MGDMSFIDPSGGRSDSYTLCIGHKENGILKVHGDNFSGEWVQRACATSDRNTSAPTCQPQGLDPGGTRPGRAAGGGKEKGDQTAWRTANPLAGDLGERFVKALVGLGFKNDGAVVIEKTYGPEPETVLTIKSFSSLIPEPDATQAPCQGRDPH